MLRASALETATPARSSACFVVRPIADEPSFPPFLPSFSDVQYILLTHALSASRTQLHRTLLLRPRSSAVHSRGGMLFGTLVQRHGWHFVHARS
jgi:hypothetical protein